VTHLGADLRYALRSFARAPVFTAAPGISLALGIGANTAIFTLLDQVLLRALPVQDPEQLVLLTWKGSHYGSSWGQNALSYPMYRDFRDRNEVFPALPLRHIAEHESHRTDRARRRRACLGQLLRGALGVRRQPGD
jgi:hypothetical protein